MLPPTPSPSRRQAIQRALVRWYAENRRSLPWRSTRDPYAIWVSEVMLQQTRVATVLPYYERWMARYPTLTELAKASDDDVLLHWQGLGYYSRARRLLEGARWVLRDHGGQLPNTAEALQRLPGIGRYTAGAIASIAFGQPVPVVDGNVVRVLCRIEALRGNPNRAPLSTHLWRLAEGLVPRTAAAEFNQGMMELGATVCLPRTPRCPVCPWRKLCNAVLRGLESTLPELPARAPPEPLPMVAAVARHRGRYLVAQLPDTAPRWSGLWAFPLATLRPGEAAEHGAERALMDTLGVHSTAGQHLANLRHSVTRFRVSLAAIACRLHPASEPQAKACRAWRWANRDELADLALPAPQKKLAGMLFQRD